MAIRRTLKDKKQALQHRENTTYAWSQDQLSTKINSVKTREKSDLHLEEGLRTTQDKTPTSSSDVPENILGYPLSLIYRDIVKTVIFTILLIVILVGLFVWWK